MSSFQLCVTLRPLRLGGKTIRKEGTAEAQRTQSHAEKFFRLGHHPGNIYASGSGRKISTSPYQEVILRHPTFRVQFNQIMLDLLNGPLSVANVQAFLTQAETVISPALASDPFPTTVGSPADEFNHLRAWVAARDVNVRNQLAANGPPSSRP